MCLQIDNSCRIYFCLSIVATARNWSPVSGGVVQEW